MHTHHLHRHIMNCHLELNILLLKTHFKLSVILKKNLNKFLCFSLFCRKRRSGESTNQWQILITGNPRLTRLMVYDPGEDLGITAVTLDISFGFQLNGISF